MDEVLAVNFWSLGQFKSGQTADYAFTGRVNSDQPENLAFQTEIWATYDNTEYLLTKKQNTAPLKFSQLKLDFINTEKNFSISPGSETIYTLHYKNEEKYALDNLELGLNLNGEYVADPHQIIFKQKDYPQFSKVEPGEEGSIEVKVKTKPTIGFSSYQENGYQLEARIFAAYDDSVEKSRISIESSPFYTKVDSRLSLNTVGLFYTPLGDQIGVGSVPPVVNEYTSYWIIIKVNNTINKIKDLKVAAKVPAGIEFTNINNVSAGNQIIFNDNSRNLEWSVDSVSAFAGISSPAPEARIQLAITPASSQVGTSPALLTNISATATDTVTGAFLTASGKDITIAIFPDPSLNKVIE